MLLKKTLIRSIRICPIHIPDFFLDLGSIQFRYLQIMVISEVIIVMNSMCYVMEVRAYFLQMKTIHILRMKILLSLNLRI